MNRVVSLSLVTLFLSLFAFTAYGFPGKHHGRHGKGDWWNNTEVLEQLKLTDQQKSQIDAIVSSNKERLDNLQSQLGTGYEELKEKMKNPDSTRNEILSAYDQLQNTHKELGRAKIEMLLDMRAVLTPEQITMLADIKEQHKKEYREDK